MSKIISRQEAIAKELKRYFTGKPCKWGHTSERVVVTGNCTGCYTFTYKIEKTKRQKISYNSVICQRCNKLFTPPHHLQKYCSSECKEIYKSARQKKYNKTNIGRKIQKESSKKYSQSVKGKAYHKEYAQSEEIRKKQKIYRSLTQTKQKIEKWKLSKGKQYFRDLINKNQKARRNTDPIFKLRQDIRNRLNIFLKISNISKRNKTFIMIGCTPQFLKAYLEKQFYSHPLTNKNMTWKNHSLKGWHIDHIEPLSLAKTPEDVEKLMHYTNLEPMWAEYNIKKGNKII